MKFGPFSALLSLYWGVFAVFCGSIAAGAYERGEPVVLCFAGSSALFLSYGALRLLMREKPYTWKRERPFWLFMTEEERRNDR